MHHIVDKCYIKVPKLRNYLTGWPFVRCPFFRVALRQVGVCPWTFVQWPYVQWPFVRIPVSIGSQM